GLRAAGGGKAPAARPPGPAGPDGRRDAASSSGRAAPRRAPRPAAPAPRASAPCGAEADPARNADRAPAAHLARPAALGVGRRRSGTERGRELRLATPPP